ncbi:MAG: radical SAM family heme chaperone HemW, partial [Clostridiales bacterium]|nr:radical SAM family heme chaperone HemW [Clostridiales bacterium]
MPIQALYVHIPFCVRRCNYCDFVSYPLTEKRDLAEDYGALLLQELDFWRGRLELSALSTVYVGGGTPTLWPGLPDFLHELRERLGLEGCDEITVEANPGTVDAALLACLRRAGVNRLSLGAQSFCDENLARMGRTHRSWESARAVALAREAGFDNINIDLIYGLPGQSAAQWRDDLERALSLQTEHISLYGLSIHEETPWGREPVRRSLVLPPDDLCADMQLLGMEMLPAAGFSHYEIANFARPGHQCRHNLAYWQRLDYLGLGVSAASFINEKRFVNHEAGAYERAMRRGEAPVAQEEAPGGLQILAEAVFLGLRLRRGINLAEFAARFGRDLREAFTPEIKSLREFGLLELEGGFLRLTDKGLLLANEVFVR